ncbi:MAG: right-handed parallel beta-helix repeat-containing protein [Candidatus Hydrogenedentota bacterium]
MRYGVRMLSVILTLMLGVHGFGFRATAGEASASGEADFFVAVDGDNAAPGTHDRPFATLARARDAVRERLKNGPQDEDITVFLRGGTYFVKETVSFGPEDSGQGEHHVLYTSYPGETALIVGGQRIANYEELDEGLYRAALPPDWEFHQVFFNGARMTKARHPNDGYLIVESSPKGSRKEFTFKEGDIPRWDDWRGAQAYIWAGADWFSNTIPVKDIDWSTRNVTLSSPTLQEIGRKPHRRYFLQGVRGALDQPGEFWRDPDSGDLYFRPPAEPLDMQVIVAPTVTRIVSVAGASPEEPVRNIVFRNLHFTISKFADHFMETHGTHGSTPWNEPANKEAALYFEHADNCAVENCRITNAGFSGISVVWRGQQNRFTGNEITECGFHGVLLSGYRVAFGRDMDLNKDNEVANNWLHHCGRLVGHGGGVFMWASGHNRIVHNRIHDMPRYGICMKGERWGKSGFSEELRKQGATRETHYDFVHSRANLFAHNDIFAVSQDTEDNGFISFWGIGKDNIVDHNHLHDAYREHLGGLGMAVYLDDGADYVTVSNNVIHDIQCGTRLMPVFAKGIHNVIENNILVCEENSETAVRSFEMASEPVRHHVYRRNIILLRGNASIYRFQNWSDDRVAEADYNLIYHPEGVYRVEGIPGEETWENWSTLFDGKFDQHSLTADPLFVDVQAGNYRLNENSPAEQIGFEPIDMDSFGLDPNHPYFKENR